GSVVMGAIKQKSAAEPTVVTVTYDLFDLPTAQHKAGLAGLVLHIRHMEGRSPRPPAIPVIRELNQTSATVEFSQESVQALFNDLYAAETVEVKVKSKWAGAKEKREPEVVEVIEDDKPKKVKLFVYEVVQPTGPFLRQHLFGEREAWHKLWRD